MKSRLYLFLMFLIVFNTISCNQYKLKTYEKPLSQNNSNPISVNSKLSGKGIGFDCANCTEFEKSKIRYATMKANEVVQSTCFENFMLEWGLIWTNKQTPKQVVDNIKNANLRVPVRYYMGNCTVVGYRQPPKPDVYFNRCTHDSYKLNKIGICNTASNATHEWSHTLGYSHPFNRTWNRGKTVPYAINKAFESCCQ